MIRIHSIRIATLSFAAMSAMTIATAFFPAGSAMAAGGPALSSGEPRVAQLCTGTGENHKCLYCVHYDGGKDCFWVKVPEKPNADIETASDDLAAAPDTSETRGR